MKKYAFTLIAALLPSMLWAAVTVTHQADVAPGYPRMMVAEEVTGTWCGYCPLGIAKMKEMNEAHPDRFIGIAVHADVSTSWPDPMGVGVETYHNALFDNFRISGYPKCVANRTKKYVNSPAMLSYYYKMIMEDGDLTYVGVKPRCSYDEATGHVNVTTDIMFADDVVAPYFRVAYVVVEDRVHVPYSETPGTSFNGYEQNNYYAGGGMGDCGGFENQPSVISADKMYYDDVARGIYPAYEGDEPFAHGSTIKRGDVYTLDYEFALPSSVRNTENCRIVVLLLDGDGRVCNAARAELLGGSGIGSVTAEPADDAYYTLTGMRVANPGPGIYLHRGRKVCITR